MASNISTSKPLDGSSFSGSLISPTNSRERRDSINSVSVSSTLEKEQMAQALDQIHTAASRTDSLTLFNESFAPPPVVVPDTESRGTVQQGLSGLYTRLRVAVGAASSSKAAQREDDAEKLENLTRKASTGGEGHRSKPSISSLSRTETAATISSTSSQPAQPDVSSPTASIGPTDLRSQMPATAKSGSISLIGGSKSHPSGRQSLPTNATSDVTAAEPTITSARKREPSRSSAHTEDSAAQGSRRGSTGRPGFQTRLSPVDSPEGSIPSGSQGDESVSSVGGASGDAPLSPVKGKAPLMSPLQTLHSRSPSAASSLLSPDDVRRKPAVIDRISHSNQRRYAASRDSSMDRGTAEASPIITSAHNSVHHNSFSQESNPQHSRSGDVRIPGTTASHQGATDQMNAQLDRMRRQILSKEFWMKDETVKECFLCQAQFTAFRRKHHCRTCGFIFDSKCTIVIPGDKFGLPGSLRVCKRCLDVITRRFDASASEDSGDEQSFLPRIFGTEDPRKSTVAFAQHPKEPETLEGSETSRPVNTPMMTIQAARRVKESNNNSSVLEIGAPQLSRPSSSRSLKSLSSGRPQSSAGHKRHHSKHGLLGRIKPDQAPFRKGIQEENAKRTKFPAFHDDNIIDPELADFMSDDSSGDEQVGSIFATLASAEIPPASFDPDKSNLSSLMNTTKKHQHHRHRGGEKSVSGMSHFSRSGFGLDELAPGFASHRRTNRRRNLSNVSGSVHHFGSPRPKSVYKGPSASSELLFPVDNSIHPNHSGTQLTRSNSLQKRKAAKTKLNESSLKHVDKLLHQLLLDADIPNPEAWKKALVPILLQTTDDVSPDVANGESMDIRTYVKLKRIPGGKPGDTSYISGIVFTKNVALKSMPRKITNPRILLVGFPIEYQRHQQQFMSLEPVIAQEKEFLRIVVQRIAQLKPQVLLAEKTISGLALQYLSEANISVAFNVKRSVIAAVARCTETKIIESLDMLEAQVGRCSAFEVRTFVNNDYPGRKKSYIFLSGCRPELGCTITLRGASDALLAKMKYITDFMVYVVYNLKLESSLLRDESVEPPEANEATSMSNSFQALNESIRSLNSVCHTSNGGGRGGPIVVVNQPSSESEPPSQLTMDSSSLGGTDEALSQPPLDQMLSEPPRLLSLHESHTHDSTFSQVPDDVPMPTFYSDMVAKYETKILSVSPYVRFTQPYLLMKAREQERRLLYLKRLRDQDMIEEDLEKSEPPKFQLIKPEMVEELGQKAPRQIMEILHAVHDAEYDKALYNYQTQTRQWETYIQGNLDLFDPYSHQNIIILYSVICTETKIPCTEPSLVGINFYDEQREDTSMDPDCTLGQYIEYLVNSKDEICDSNGCDRKMAQHHRTFVHDQFRITVFVEHLPNAPPRLPELGDGISMWSYCKLCQKDSEEIAMSETTFKYSFGKYLELLYWGRGLRMKDAMECPHDHQKDHVRYFSLHDSRVRIHWDPIDLLEIVVPRARLTWKVSNDLKLKNDIFGKMDERWAKFMTSVIARLESIRIDSVLPEKAESCKAELDRLMQKAKEEEAFMVQRLQDIYVNSKYYEVVPFNIIVREMLETASEWDQVFATFEADFLGDKDMRQLTMLQLKKMFTDNESKESLGSNEGTGSAADSEERPSQTFSEAEEKSTQPTDFTDNSMEASATSSKLAVERVDVEGDGPVQAVTQEAIDHVRPSDLASAAPVMIQDSQAATGNEDAKAAPAASAATTPPDTAPTSQSPASPVRMARSPTNSSISGQSLSERIDASALKRSAQPRQSQDSNERPADMETPRQVSEQGVRRKSTTSTSPPMARAISQPSRTLSRLQSLGKSAGSSESVAKVPETANSDQQSEGSIKSDKKLSERLGLNVLKNRGKMAGSSIPRLVPKKKESKVTTLAKHFEQLSREFSREFEKERIRDRKKRAASMRNPRPMLPKTSTQAIVQVYDNVNEAFDEPAVTSEPNTEQELPTIMQEERDVIVGDSEFDRDAPFSGQISPILEDSMEGLLEEVAPPAETSEPTGQETTELKLEPILEENKSSHSVTNRLTHSLTVESPENNRDDESLNDLELSEANKTPKRRRRKGSAWDTIAASIVASKAETTTKLDRDTGLQSPDLPVDDNVNSTSPTLGPRSVSPKLEQSSTPCLEDLEFEATVAAGLKESGFDPNIIIDDPAFRRRDSRPETNEAPVMNYDAPDALSALEPNSTSPESSRPNILLEDKVTESLGPASDMHEGDDDDEYEPESPFDDKLLERIKKDGTAISMAIKEKGSLADDMDIDQTDEVRLYGGIAENGRPAELVRIKKDGTAISIATGKVINLGESKRSLSEERQEEEEIMRQMARRKKNASPEELAPKKCREPGCTKEFKRPCDLTKHEKTHSRPWKCPIPTCKYHDYGWPTEKEMDRHINDKHSDAPAMFECLFKPCPYKSKRESNCKQHMEKAHGWNYVRTKLQKVSRPAYDMHDFHDDDGEYKPPAIPGTGFENKAPENSGPASDTHEDDDDDDEYEPSKLFDDKLAYDYGDNDEAYEPPAIPGTLVENKAPDHLERTSVDVEDERLPSFESVPNYQAQPPMERRNSLDPELESIEDVWEENSYEAPDVISITTPKEAEEDKDNESAAENRINLRREALGEKHPDTIRSIANLAATYYNQGRLNEAEALIVQVLDLRREVLGEKHPETTLSMANLASLYHAQGRYSEAEAMEVQVLDLRQELLGKKHPDTLFAIHNLAHTWKMQGRHHDALALMEECVQSRRSVLGPEHPLTVKSIEYLERWKSEDETLGPNRVDEKSEPSRDDLDQAATTPSRLNTEDEPESFAQPDDVTIRFKGTNAKLSNTELSSWANASDGSDLAEDLDDPPELRLYTPTSKSLPFHRVLARPQQAASSLPTQAILEKADEVDPGVEEDFGPRLKRVGHIEFDKIAEANTEINKRHTVPPPAPPYTPLETTTAVVDDDGANDKTMADTVKRSDGMGSDPIKFPQRRPTVEDILRMERERNKPNEILRIPGPRETERGSGPRRIEGDDEQEDEDRLIARQTTVESGDDEPNDKMKAYERKPIIYEEDLRYREKEKHDEEEAQRQRLLERFMPRRRNTAGEDSRRRPVIVDDSTPGGTYNDSHITAEESTVDQLEVLSNSEEPTRKRMQSRKGLERRFECNAEGCGKSYSRAEHLYRHQLNHNSKQIFRCEYPNCVRTFVRGDLLKRHMDRHTAKGSQLDRRDSMVSHAASVASPKLAPADSSRPVPVPVPIEARSSRMDRAPYEPHKPNEPITYEHAPYDPSLAASKLY